MLAAIDRICCSRRCHRRLCRCHPLSGPRRIGAGPSRSSCRSGCSSSLRLLPATATATAAAVLVVVVLVVLRVLRVLLLVVLLLLLRLVVPAAAAHLLRRHRHSCSRQAKSNTGHVRVSFQTQALLRASPQGPEGTSCARRHAIQQAPPTTHPPTHPPEALTGKNPAGVKE